MLYTSICIYAIISPKTSIHTYIHHLSNCKQPLSLEGNVPMNITCQWQIHHQGLENREMSEMGRWIENNKVFWTSTHRHTEPNYKSWREGMNKDIKKLMELITHSAVVCHLNRDTNVTSAGGRLHAVHHLNFLCFINMFHQSRIVCSWVWKHKWFFNVMRTEYQCWYS